MTAKVEILKEIPGKFRRKKGNNELKIFHLNSSDNVLVMLYVIEKLYRSKILDVCCYGFWEFLGADAITKIVEIKVESKEEDGGVTFFFFFLV